jgi:hypothetical protein
MEASTAAVARLYRRGVRLEWFTVTWNVLEAVIAVTAGVLAGGASR